MPFAEHLINLRGVKPRGIVEQSEYEPLLKLISDKLKELRTRAPTAGHQTNLAAREVFHGPYANEAADMILDWWETSHFSTSHSFLQNTLPRSKSASEAIDRVRWGGTHRRDGILIAHGKSLRRMQKYRVHGSLIWRRRFYISWDSPCPKTGWSRVELSSLPLSREAPFRSAAARLKGRTAQYSDEEAVIVEERLKALGYIE